MQYQPSRRDFAKLAMGALTVSSASALQSKFSGVRIGAGSFTFRGMSIDDIIKLLAAVPIGGIELDSLFIEPGANNAPAARGPAVPGAAPAPRGGGRGMTPEQREAIRKWRLTVSLDEFKAIRTKMKKAGITINAYAFPMNDTFTDEEIDRGFQFVKALGALAMNSSANMVMAKRIAPFATKHKIRVGIHPSGMATAPDAVVTAAHYAKVFELSPYMGANLDLSGAANWGPDPMEFIKANNSRITTVHFHDRKNSPPGYVPFGEGDSPTKPLLQLIKKEKYKFAISIERLYQVPNLDQLTEMRRSLEYCKSVL